MAKTIYDLCVIGGGMFGSAAARHASAIPSVKVCLVDPAEPTPEEFPRREIFGAYYDEGRVTRVLDEAPACQILSKHSISRHRELEKLSGITFYTPVGCLFTGSRNGKFIQSCLQSGATYKVPLVEITNGATLQRRFPYLKLKENEIALLDDIGGGYISPRNLVAAQKKVARLQGCHIVESVVCETETQSDGIHTVKTESKGEIKAKRLLIATGSFVNMKKLEVLKPLLVKRMKETVVLLNVPEDEVRRLSSMPCMISIREKKSAGHIGAYILPPIKYPDGQYYLKFGKSHSYKDEDELKTLEQLRDWYLSDGDKEMEDTHVKFISDLIPGLKFTGISKLTCAACLTPSGLPYIDRVSPTVSVAVAGNVKGAKFSDEVGRIAAHLSLTGQWDSGLSRSLFEAVFQ